MLRHFEIGHCRCNFCMVLVCDTVTSEINGGRTTQRSSVSTGFANHFRLDIFFLLNMISDPVVDQTETKISKKV